MNITKAIFSFEGRSKRTEYWKIQATLFVAYIVMGIIVALVIPKISEDAVLDAIRVSGIVLFVILIPLGIIAWAVVVRRLHDINLSGWYALILIPLAIIDKVGVFTAIALIIIGLIPSSLRDTKYESNDDKRI